MSAGSAGPSSAHHDAVVIGAGHNGLIAAGYLAKAGMKTLVLERSETVGGAAKTGELAPGVRVPTVAHTVGRLRRSVVRELELYRHGLHLIRPDVRAFAPQPEGRAVTLWADPARTAEGLRDWSASDADAYRAFDRRIRSLASFLAYLAVSTPPDIKAPSVQDAVMGLKLGRAFQGMGPRTRREALRALPMAVADLVGEAFETDALRGVLATRGVRYAALGPWSAGTAAVLLFDSAGTDGGAAGETAFAKGGPGALSDALMASVRAYGGEVRTDAEVVSIIERDGRATGVVLASGEEVPARAVVSATDPKRTLTRFVDPVALGPQMMWRAGNIRLAGVVSKVNLALASLPVFPAAGGDAAKLSGRIVIGAGIDALERAFDASKYGRVSAEPFLEATIPSISDPTLAPEGQHVMSVVVQWTPYGLREGDWDVEREGLGDLVLKTLEAHAPGLSNLVTARQVITPLDLERDHGLTEGGALHGEPGLDNFFAWRPLFGHARYRLVLDGLYLCGSGAHPGGGVTGGPGANAAREILADLKHGR
jgi:phytoene dehydrogenase-like protein